MKTRRGGFLTACALLLLLVAATPLALVAQQSNGDEISYSAFLTAVESGKVGSVEISGQSVAGSYRDNSNGFRTTIGTDEKLIPLLREKGVEVRYKEASADPTVMMILQVFPMVLLLAVWLFFMRQVKAKSAKDGNGRSKLSI